VAERDTDEKDLRGEDRVEIANEFAYVHVRKVHTRNGERLEIRSPRRDSLIRLDPMELEAISGLDPEQLARLLEDPPVHSH
jgi:hypothetical protein